MNINEPISPLENKYIIQLILKILIHDKSFVELPIRGYSNFFSKNLHSFCHISNIVKNYVNSDECATIWLYVLGMEKKPKGNENKPWFELLEEQLYYMRESESLYKCGREDYLRNICYGLDFTNILSMQLPGYYNDWSEFYDVIYNDYYDGLEYQQEAWEMDWI